MSFYFHHIGDKDGEFLGGFSGYSDPRYLTEEEKNAHPGVKGMTTWHITSAWGKLVGGRSLPIRGFSREESREIIREAMLSYRAVCGNPVGNEWLYLVEINF